MKLLFRARPIERVVQNVGFVLSVADVTILEAACLPPVTTPILAASD